MLARNLFTILILLAVPSFIVAQNKVIEQLTTSNEWTSGSILTIDGKELKGSLKYDDKLGVLNYDDGIESRIFNPRQVTAFEFFDEEANKQRLFYSLEYQDPVKSMRTPLFFEVLKDFGSFAVLSTVDPVNIDASTNTYTDPTTGQRTTTSGPVHLSQVETVYFLDENGKIEPYIQVVKKVIDRRLFDEERNKNKYINKDIVTKYFKKEELEKMRAYAEKNDLDFRAKDELIKILNYCEELRAKDQK